MHVALVAALAENGVIGANGTMPWHVPEELAYFKRTTMGHPMVMGRKTFASIGRVLPGRHTIVLTRDTQWAHAGVDRAGSIDDALALAAAAGERGFDASEAVVVGGAQIYALAMPRATRLYLTRIEASFDGDTFFPVFDPGEWRELSARKMPPTSERDFSMTYQVLERL